MIAQSGSSARFGAVPTSFPIARAIESIGGGGVDGAISFDVGGTVYISPEYESALAIAHMWLMARSAGTLGRAPIAAFVREDRAGNTTGLQRQVRAQFLLLVVAAYNKARHRVSGAARKLAGDAFNIAADVEDALRWFERTVAYDASSGHFYERPTGTAISSQCAATLAALRFCSNSSGGPVRALPRIAW
jgi:hypothetical protein